MGEKGFHLYLQFIKKKLKINKLGDNIEKIIKDITCTNELERMNFKLWKTILDISKFVEKMDFYHDDSIFEELLQELIDKLDHHQQEGCEFQGHSYCLTYFTAQLASFFYNLNLLTRKYFNALIQSFLQGKSQQKQIYKCHKVIG